MNLLYSNRRATRNFSGQGRLGEIRAFRSTFYQKVKKKAPQGKILEFFLLDTLKLHFEWQI